MLKTKIALAAVLLAGTASLAVAQEADPNLLNRYPQYNGAVAGAPQGAFQSGAFQSAPVRLQEGRNVGHVQQHLNNNAIGTRDAVDFRYDSAPLISGGGY